ncbi:hypothetical protein [Mesorhizobium salmacidum]|uniref:Uncharacterized protein n=1 Tax=Mesorhizobium salmacidum TaxID=3015171 RepID=A0ABU8L5E2_9HYPH
MAVAAGTLAIADMPAVFEAGHLYGLELVGPASWNVETYCKCPDGSFSVVAWLFTFAYI